LFCGRFGFCERNPQEGDQHERYLFHNTTYTGWRGGEVAGLYLCDMERVVAQGEQVGLSLRRMAWQIAERGESFVLVGLEPRGSRLAQWLKALLEGVLQTAIPMGTLDVTLWRDDLHHHRKLRIPRPAHLPFAVEGQHIWLVDDVLYTGRTVRAALDALREWGRPAWVRLAVLVERRGLREFPIVPDCVGFVLDTAPEERVQVVLEPRPLIRLHAKYE